MLNAKGWDKENQQKKKTSHPFETWQQRLEIPSIGIPSIIVHCLGSRVHHEVDGTPTSEDPTTWYNGFAAQQFLAALRFVEEGSFGVGCKVSEVEGRSCHGGVIEVILAAFHEENGE